MEFLFGLSNLVSLSDLFGIADSFSGVCSLSVDVWASPVNYTTHHFPPYAYHPREIDYSLYRFHAMLEKTAGYHFRCPHVRNYRVYVTDPGVHYYNLLTLQNLNSDSIPYFHKQLLYEFPSDIARDIKKWWWPEPAPQGDGRELNLGSLRQNIECPFTELNKYSEWGLKHYPLTPDVWSWENVNALLTNFVDEAIISPFQDAGSLYLDISKFHPGAVERTFFRIPGTDNFCYLDPETNLCQTIDDPEANFVGAEMKDAFLLVAGIALGFYLLF